MGQIRETDMKVESPPEHVCPECLARPPLVYRTSIGLTPRIHFYLCPLSGVQYMARDGGPEPRRTPSVQYPARPSCGCATCGKTMHVEMRTRLWAKRLVWRCVDCGTTEAFHPADLP